MGTILIRVRACPSRVVGIFAHAQLVVGNLLGQQRRLEFRMSSLDVLVDIHEFCHGFACQTQGFEVGETQIIINEAQHLSRQGSEDGGANRAHQLQYPAQGITVSNSNYQRSF